jgi:hypothetical protein
LKKEEVKNIKNRQKRRRNNGKKEEIWQKEQDEKAKQ